MHIHICLVSAQLLANYIPIRMDKPDLVILLSSTAMRQQAQRFSHLLQQQGVAHQTRHDVPDAGMAEIQRFAAALLQTLQHEYPAAALTVNITGGTKLMSIGLLDVFAAAGQRIIYTDTAKNRLESLQDGGLEPLQAVLGIRDYLQANGATVLHTQSADEVWHGRAWQRREAAQLLAGITQHPPLKSLITVLNALSLKALAPNGEELLYPQQCFTHPLNGEWRAMVQQLVAMQLLAVLPNQQDVVFLDAERTRFLCGHWLEEYAWLVAERVGLDEVACGVDIEWENSRTRNELDVVAVHNNRLLAIECKTARFGNRGSKGNDVLYKIDSISHELKGLYGETVLLSAWGVPPVMMARAKTQQVRILRPLELEAYLKQWMELSKK